MTREIEEKLAASLTAETNELIPFLPYLLQDFWELGSEPNVIIKLIESYIGTSEDTRILDLACGKGPVSVKAAQKLRVQVKGVDLISDFIKFAVQKAQEYNVSDLCEFIVEDINETVKKETNYDCVILGAVGNVLGSPIETLNKLKATVKTGGYILIDDCYLPDDGSQEDIRYNNYEYLTKKQWEALFREAGLELIKTAFESDSLENLDSVSGMAAITARANELIEKYPDKKGIFEGYIRSQKNEYDDINNSLITVTWILKKL